MIPATERVFIGGNSGSGKTTTAWRLYLSRMPRVIVIDTLGEWDEFKLPDGSIIRATEVAWNLTQLHQAIRTHAPRGRFVIATFVEDRAEMETLMQWLVPPGEKESSPVIKLGGMALLVDEVDVHATSAGPPPLHIRTLYRRSRHVGLTVISATQRPANVSKEVTAQSTQIIAHALHEPADRDYMVDAMRWTRAESQAWMNWTTRHRHGFLWKRMATGETLAYPDSLSAPVRLVSAQQTLGLMRSGDDDARPAAASDQP